jgi:hypothetical protein
MKLKAALETLRDQKSKMVDSKGMKLYADMDTQRGVLEKAMARHEKALAALAASCRVLDKALDDDANALVAYMENTDKSAESWLEEDVEAAAKVTKNARAKYEPANEEHDAAMKQLEAEKAKMDKLDAEDREYRQQFDVLEAEGKKIKARIAALQKDLIENPSLGRKLKDLLKP